MEDCENDAGKSGGSDSSNDHMGDLRTAPRYLRPSEENDCEAICCVERSPLMYQVGSSRHRGDHQTYDAQGQHFHTRMGIHIVTYGFQEIVFEPSIAFPVHLRLLLPSVCRSNEANKGVREAG